MSPVENSKLVDPLLASTSTREDSIERRKKCVLICDDQEDILYVITAFFKNKYNTLVAKSGGECLRIFDEENTKGNTIDVLLLDYKLGDLTGEETARKLRENKQACSTRIVLITAYEMDDAFLSKMYEEKLIDAQLKKPFSMADLRGLVARLMD